MAEPSTGEESGQSQRDPEIGLPALAPASLATLPREDVAAMRLAAREVRTCVGALDGADLNLVGELLRGHETFFELEHYPPDDVFDRRSHSQYYYHAHRGLAGEHGHFHTFLRAAGMPAGLNPVAYAGDEPWPAGADALAHLIGISMDAYGDAIGLFAVNRWVTGDTWYSAGDVIRMLDRFEITHAHPSWPVNRWITAMLRLYRPEIEVLLLHRDAVVRRWAQAHPEADVFEDRALEITGEIRINVAQRLRDIEVPTQARSKRPVIRPDRIRQEGPS